MNKVLLTNDELKDLVYENILREDSKVIEVRVLVNKHDSDGRHQSYYDFVFQRLDNLKYYQTYYSTSVKDTMGWDECNYDKNELIEVEPIEETIITYKVKNNE